MKIPRALYGTHSETKKWCTQHVKLIVKGATFEELDFGELTETGVGPIDLIAEVQRTGVVEGLVLLDSGRVRNPEQHFRLYPFVDGLTTKWAERRGGAKPIEQLFHWAGSGAAWRVGCSATNLTVGGRTHDPLEVAEHDRLHHGVLNRRSN